MLNKKQLNFLKRLEKYDWIGKYIIDENNIINVYGNLSISNMNLNKIPVKFGKIIGLFSCSRNNLITFDNLPYSVEGDFYCYDNKFTEDEFSKIFNIKIGGWIICDDTFNNIRDAYYNMRNISNAI